MSTAAGQRDRLITIERYTMAEGDLNPVKTWATLTTAWAKREDVSASEMVAAGELGSAIVSRFIVPRDSVIATVTPADRLLYEGARWNIDAVRERREASLSEVEIRAKRAVS